jgi:hypothetical protein
MVYLFPTADFEFAGYKDKIWKPEDNINAGTIKVFIKLLLRVKSPNGRIFPTL